MTSQWFVRLPPQIITTLKVIHCAAKGEVTQHWYALSMHGPTYRYHCGQLTMYQLG